MKEADKKMKLEEERRKIKKKLAKMPEGNLIAHKNGENISYLRALYIIENFDGKTKTRRVRNYISKSNRRLIYSLTKKLILEKRLRSVETEIKALDKYLKLHHPPNEDLIKILEKGGPISVIIKEVLDQERKELLEWQNSDYKKLEVHPEQLKYKSIAGTWHRSKSEVLIANALYIHGIPFRYDCCVIMKDGREYYPDFVIMHPVTREIFIWEHFGMMDIESYLFHAMDKIAIYGKSGYIVNDKLIVTMESETMHIDAEEIDEIIEKFFVC